MKPTLPVFFAGFALLMSGCGGRSSTEASQPPLPPVRVHEAVVHLESRPAFSETVGAVRPVRSAQLSAKVMGSVEAMPVALGQKVAAGTVLLKISAREITARVAQAEAGLNAARRDYERERDLLAKGASTADMVKGLGDRLAAAEAMAEEARVMEGYASVRAPFDGVIAAKTIDIGDLAAPGQPLLTVESADRFLVEVPLPESDTVGTAVGARVEVSVPGRDVSFSGRLAELSSASDPGAHTVLAKVEVPEGTAVRSGDFARVRIAGAQVRSLRVPAGAVSVLGQMQRVFVVGDDQRAVMRLVKTGESRAGSVEILSGLDDGERIVVDPPAQLREGQPLEAQP
jgi:membrane fusion protein, multidrug efflux system